jgi:hypothetical protein
MTAAALGTQLRIDSSRAFDSAGVPGWSAHVSGEAEDDSVTDGQHVPAGPVDYSFLVDGDQMRLRVSDVQAVADRQRTRHGGHQCH